GTATPLLLLDACRDGGAIGECSLRAMATCAGHRAVGREPLVEVKQPAEFALGMRVGIVVGPDDGRQTLGRRGRFVTLCQRGADADRSREQDDDASRQPGHSVPPKATNLTVL